MAGVVKKVRKNNKLTSIFGKNLLMLLDPVLRKTDKNSKDKIEAWTSRRHIGLIVKRRSKRFF